MNEAVIGLDTVLILLLSTSCKALTSLRLFSLDRISTVYIGVTTLRVENMIYALPVSKTVLIVTGMEIGSEGKQNILIHVFLMLSYFCYLTYVLSLICAIVALGLNWKKSRITNICTSPSPHLHTQYLIQYAILSSPPSIFLHAKTM